MTIIERQVGASSDDCQKDWSGSSWIWKALDYAYVSVGYYSSNTYKRGGGMRFLNITIPQGATITSAILKLYAHSTQSVTTVNSKIHGEDVDGAATFSTMADYDGRDRTSAVVNWDSIGSWTIDTWYTSPDIKTIIQEIVNRAGWSSGNDIVIFWDDHDDRSSHTAACRRLAKSYDGSSTYAPKLEITYTSGVTYTKTWQSDVLFKKLGITKTAVVDTAFKKPDITKAFTLDSTFQKTTQIPKQVDTLFKKLDILKTFGLDTDFLKKTIIESFAIDTRFGALQTHELSKKIDGLFKKLGITKTFSVDVDFQRTQQLQRQIDVFFEKTIAFSKQVDALFKKFETPRTFSLDAWFGTVGAVTYIKTFGLDVVFRYKVKLPTILGITLDGQLVIPLKKEVWIGN